MTSSRGLGSPGRWSFATRVLFVGAAAPLVVLVALALAGARDDVGVVTSGVGPHALLGAAWVAAWLFTIAVSPSLAVAGALSALRDALERRAASRATSPVTSPATLAGYVARYFP